VIHHQVPSQMACHLDGEAYVFGDEADTRRQTKLCLVCDLCGIRPGEEHDPTRSALGSFRHDEVVLAALKVRRDRRFPKTGNHASSEGTKNREPTSEPSQAEDTTSQVSAVAAVPGTNGNQRELATLSSGTRFPLSIGEPVPDWPENDDLEAAGYPSDGEEWK